MRYFDGPKVGVIILLFILAQIPFGLGEWLSVAQSPDDAGLYTILIKAIYDGFEGAYPIDLRVRGKTTTSEGLSVSPAYTPSKKSPINLGYIIHIDNSTDFDMLENNMSLYFVDGTTLVANASNILSKNPETGFWEVTVMPPLKGDYKVLLSVTAQKGDMTYLGDFASYLESESASTDLLLQYTISPKVLTPTEAFSTTLLPIFGGNVLKEFIIFRANINGNDRALVWNEKDGVYSSDFSAPTLEGAYAFNFYGKGQDFSSSETIYIVDTSQAKAPTCPLVRNSSCEDMRDVRRCVFDSKAGMGVNYTETDLISCFKSVRGDTVVSAVICGWNKGDLNGDGKLTVSDAAILQTIILPLPQPSRRDYLSCADYDRDSDVDEADLTCMTNVIAGKWWGDLNGGVCFDMVLDSPLAGDLDGNRKITEVDLILMRKLVDADTGGILMHERILSAADFDQSGRIDSYDAICAKKFEGVEVNNTNNLIGNVVTIPTSCLEIYHLDSCNSVKGDINGDYKIDEIDEILITLIVEGKITGYDMNCSDVNKDNQMSSEDIFCVSSYLAGDMEQYYACLKCDEYTPREYLDIMEICNDGWDNDCDGLIDRTGTTGTGGDFCSCTSNTPCAMVWDEDGGTIAGINDANVLVCRKESWRVNESAIDKEEDQFEWVSPKTLVCNEDKECEYAQCADSRFYCAFDGGGWLWYENPGDLPTETDDSKAEPKLCDDGYDNDCICGDMKCAVEEQGSIFDSWLFWLFFALFLIASIFLPGWATLLISLAASLVSLINTFAGGPAELSAAMGGISMGCGVGGLLNGAGVKDILINSFDTLMEKGLVAGTTQLGSQAISSVTEGISSAASAVKDAALSVKDGVMSTISGIGKGFDSLTSMDTYSSALNYIGIGGESGASSTTSFPGFSGLSESFGFADSSFQMPDMNFEYFSMSEESTLWGDMGDLAQSGWDGIKAGASSIGKGFTSLGEGATWTGAAKGVGQGMLDFGKGMLNTISPWGGMDQTSFAFTAGKLIFGRAFIPAFSAFTSSKAATYYAKSTAEWVSRDTSC